MMPDGPTVRKRNAEEMRDALLALADWQLRRLEVPRGDKSFSEWDLKAMCQINTIISAHLRTVDPLDQRKDETDEQYRERLERMRKR